MSKELSEYRKKIDAIDREIINLIQNRSTLVKEIGKIKSEKNYLHMTKKDTKSFVNQELNGQQNQASIRILLINYSS